MKRNGTKFISLADFKLFFEKKKNDFGLFKFEFKFKIAKFKYRNDLRSTFMNLLSLLPVYAYLAQGMDLSISIHGASTLSIMTCSIMTYSITRNKMQHSA
jgi:hypothetical protein